MTALRQRPLASRLWTLALDALFPPRCVDCRSFGSFVCEACRAKVLRAEHPRCGVCWQPDKDSRCWQCRTSPPAFTAVRSVYTYAGPARGLVHQLKFAGVSALAQEMAEEMAGLLLGWQPDAAALVPVPMAGPRRRRRGYNQSQLLAREVSRRTGIPFAAGALVRRDGPSQVGQPDEEARRRNAARSFVRGRSGSGGEVVLIDDVMTTGATLDACARVLKSAGAERVYGLTFAREG